MNNYHCDGKELRNGMEISIDNKAMVAGGVSKYENMDGWYVYVDDSGVVRISNSLGEAIKNDRFSKIKSTPKGGRYVCQTGEYKGASVPMFGPFDDVEWIKEPDSNVPVDSLSSEKELENDVDNSANKI